MKEDSSTVEVWRDGVAPSPSTSRSGPTTAPPWPTAQGETLWIADGRSGQRPGGGAQEGRRYLDLFEVTGDRAVRKARIYAPKLRWGWVGDKRR
jgi:hypothetical protein